MPTFAVLKRPLDTIYTSVSNIILSARGIQSACLRIMIEDDAGVCTPKAMNIIRNIKMEIPFVYQHWGPTTWAMKQIELAIAKVCSILDGSEKDCFEYGTLSTSATDMSLLQFCRYATSIAMDALVICKAVILCQDEKNIIDTSSTL